MLTKENLAYIVNIFSFALFFYLASTLEAQIDSPLLKYLAWFFLGTGIFLIVLSIAAFVSNREAGLIVGGIYGTIRHPMYLGAMVLFLSWIFFLPHWIILLVSMINITIVYGFILQGEAQNITKFGDPYRHYMDAVPRINLIAGLMRRLRSK